MDRSSEQQATNLSSIARNRRRSIIYAVTLGLLIATSYMRLSPDRLFRLMNPSTHLHTKTVTHRVGNMSRVDNDTQPTSSGPLVPVKRGDVVFQNSWTSPIVVEEHNLVFFAFPKVGSSLFKMLLRRMSGHSDYTKRNQHDPQTNGLRYLFHYSRQRATHWMNSPNVTRALFVRDPKSRFLSAYLDKALAKGGYFLKAKCCREGRAHKALFQDQTEWQCIEKGRSSLQGFFNMTKTCDDNHWGLQSEHIDDKFCPKINFVGHLETAEKDTKQLLIRLGLWKKYGASGWGRHFNESIFASSDNVQHATRAKTASEKQVDSSWQRLTKYYSPDLELQVEERYARDYDHPTFGLVRRKIPFPEGNTNPENIHPF